MVGVVVMVMVMAGCLHNSSSPHPLPPPSCRASSNGPYYGGPLVDRAVNAVFAALIWHSQDIREELASVCTYTV